MRGFDPLVPFYDFLASIVFFGAIHRSHKYLIQQIQFNSKVLILGGGTGKLLKHLDKSIVVTYVELSEKMIQKAKQRKTKALVKFEQVDFLEWNSLEEYDYVICPFFLDLFSDKELGKVINQIESYLSSKGQLLVADFDGNTRSWINKILLRVMFVFFSTTHAIAIKKYNNLFKKLEQQFNTNIQGKTFYNEFIKTSFYS